MTPRMISILLRRLLFIASPYLRLSLAGGDSADGFFVELDLHVVVHAYDHGLVLDQDNGPVSTARGDHFVVFREILEPRGMFFLLIFLRFDDQKPENQKNKNIRDDGQRNERIHGSFSRH